MLDYLGDIREIGLISVAKALSAIFGFLAMVILARSLGPAKFGLFSLALGTMLVAMELAGQGIDVGLVRFSSLYLKEDKHQANLMFKVALELKIVAGIIVLAGGFFLAEPLALYIFDKPEVATPLKLVFLGTFGASMLRYILATLQAHQSFKKYAFLELVNSTIRIAAIVFLCFVFTATLLSAITIYVAVPFVGLLVGLLLLPSGFLNSPSFGKKEARSKLFNFSKWIIISGLLSILYSRINIFMLGYFKEASTVGMYSAAFTLVSGLDLLTVAIITVLLPKVSQMSGRQEFIGYIRWSLRITIPISIALLPLLFFTKPLISIIYQGQFIDSSSIFIILFLGAIVTLIIFPIALVFFALDLPHYVAIGDSGVLTFSFLANYLAIPKYGVIGAAWVATSGRVLMALIGLTLVYFKVYRLPFMEDLG